MNELASERRRDGAYAWSLFEDATEPGHWLEVPSWSRAGQNIFVSMRASRSPRPISRNGPRRSSATMYSPPSSTGSHPAAIRRIPGDDGRPNHRTWRAAVDRGSVRRRLLHLCPAASSPAYAQSAPPDPPPLTPLRYDEDYSYLADPNARSGAWWEPLKYIPSDETGDVYLTLGGEIRPRYESYENNNWGQEPAPDDGYGSDALALSSLAWQLRVAPWRRPS